MLTAQELRFDPETHRSWRPDGVEVPHVTTVLSAVGVGLDFDALACGSARIRAALELAADRGTAVHADCHAYDDNDLDWDTVDVRVLPYVEAWAQCREVMGLSPIARERRLYHPLWNYTGIMDGVFVRQTRDGAKNILADIKTGDPDAAAAHIQTAAYEAAWLSEDPDRTIHERWAVWLQPERRSSPFTIINYTQRPDAYLDFHKFQACLTVYAEQHGRRRRIV